MNGIDRLLSLQHENDAAGVEMLRLAPRFHALEQRHIEGTAPKAITGFNLFQTPPHIAERMADIIKAEVRPGARILEPEVGLGRLYEPFAKPEASELLAHWVMIEEVRECVHAVSEALKKAGAQADLRHRDFLTTTQEELGGMFDAVIMNPPFKMGRDIKHIQHAYGMLKVGGVLVSLCYNGVKQNKKLRPLCDTWEVLPEGSFKEEGTDASVALLTMRN